MTYALVSSDTEQRSVRLGVALLRIKEQFFLLLQAICMWPRRQLLHSRILEVTT
jgi:hypothetical protein